MWVPQALAGPELWLCLCLLCGLGQTSQPLWASASQLRKLSPTGSVLNETSFLRKTPGSCGTPNLASLHRSDSGETQGQDHTVLGKPLDSGEGIYQIDQRNPGQYILGLVLGSEKRNTHGHWPYWTMQGAFWVIINQTPLSHAPLGFFF